jgi:hypothetical protein
MGEKFNFLRIPEITGLQLSNFESLSGKGETPKLELEYIRAFYKKRFWK